MAQATILKIENARPNGSLLNLEVLVCFSGNDVQGGQNDIRVVEITGIDPTGTINQIQAQIAAGVRSQGTALGYSIATNNVNVPSFAKG